MAESFDVVVVGAGIGGLTAAARLVRAGLQVLVLDRRGYAGGTASAYGRGGFIFPTGPLGFSSPRVVEETLDEPGAAEGLTFKRVHYKLAAFGVEVVLSLPFGELAGEIASAFYAGRADLERFFAEIGRTASALRSAFEERRESELRDVPDVPAGEYLEKLFPDERVRRVLGSIGTRPPVLGVTVLAAMWDLMCNVGIYYPSGGFPSMRARFQRAVTGSGGGKVSDGGKGCHETASGGEVRLNCGVARILIHGGRARGVVLEDGTTIEGEAVISNADFKTTFLSLIDEEALPPEWRRAVEGARLSDSNFQVCLGVDAGRVDLSLFDGASRVIYRSEEGYSEEEIDWSAREIDPTLLASGELEVSLWSADDERLAQKGGAVVVIRTAADHNHFSRFRDSAGGRTSGYLHYKTGLAKALVYEVSKVLPGLGEAVKVMDVATPLTFEEQGGRYAGAVAGWSWEHGDVTGLMPRELVLTPVSGLFMAGHQAVSWLSLGGVPTAVLSGNRAASAVLASEGPATTVNVPGSRVERA